MAPHNVVNMRCRCQVTNLQQIRQINWKDLLLFWAIVSELFPRHFSRRLLHSEWGQSGITCHLGKCISISLGLKNDKVGEQPQNPLFNSSEAKRENSNHRRFLSVESHTQDLRDMELSLTVKLVILFFLVFSIRFCFPISG